MRGCGCWTEGQLKRSRSVGWAIDMCRQRRALLVADKTVCVNEAVEMKRDNWSLVCRDVTRLGLGGGQAPQRTSQPPQTGTLIGLFCTAVLDIMLL